MKTPFKCPVCQGIGSSESRNFRTSCPACNGRGIIWGGDFEQQTAVNQIASPVENQLFGKSYLMDCARTNCFFKKESYVRLFIEEVLRVLSVKQVSYSTLELKPEEDTYFIYHSLRVLVLGRWRENETDFYLDVSSHTSFDEHLIRELVLKFFEPEMYDDAIILRRAPIGYGKRFIK